MLKDTIFRGLNSSVGGRWSKERSLSRVKLENWKNSYFAILCVRWVWSFLSVSFFTWQITSLDSDIKASDLNSSTSVSLDLQYKKKCRKLKKIQIINLFYGLIIGLEIFLHSFLCCFSWFQSYFSWFSLLFKSSISFIYV